MTVEHWTSVSGHGLTIASLQEFLDDLRANGNPEDAPIYITRAGSITPCGHCTTVKAISL